VEAVLRLGPEWAAEISCAHPSADKGERQELMHSRCEDRGGSWYMCESTQCCCFCFSADGETPCLTLCILTQESCL